jgi:hypothetical protein
VIKEFFSHQNLLKLLSLTHENTIQLANLIVATRSPSMSKTRARRPAGQNPAGGRLISQGKSELQLAGLTLSDYFMTMMDPEERPPERIPDPQAGMTAVFKTPLTIDIPYCGRWNAELARSDPVDEKEPKDCYSEVILSPGTHGAYFVTLGSEGTTDLWGAGAAEHSIWAVPVMAVHPSPTDVVGGETQCSQGLRMRTTNGSPTANLALLPKKDGAGRYSFEVEIAPLLPASNCSWHVNATDLSSHVDSATDVFVRVVWSDDTVDVQSHHIHTRESISLLYTFVNPGSEVITSFSVSVADVDPSSHWVFNMSPHPASTTYLRAAARSACAFAVYDAPELGGLSETESERTTALTGLITYMGSSLADGGQIAAARLGMGTSPFSAVDGEVYSHLASYPFYNADFALREGIYAWRLPDSAQEEFYTPYRKRRNINLEEVSLLHFAMHRDDPTQGLRLRVVQNFEVITRSRLYTAAAGPNNPAYSIIATAVKALPAVTINSKHKSILARSSQWLQKWLSQPKNWQRLLTEGASVIKQMA